MQPFHVNDLLNLVSDAKAYLGNYPDPILAETEDCEYFRKRFKKAKEAVVKLHESEKSISNVQTIVSKPPVLQPPPKIEPVPEQAPAAVKKVEAHTPPPPAPKPLPEAKPIEAPAFSYHPWKALFAKIAPHCHVIPEIPNDALAKKIASRWKTKNQTAPITILSYQEIPEQKELLQGITKALDVYFGPAKLVSAEAIEKEKQWEAFLSVSDLKLVICCDYTLWQLPNLLQFYKEVPSLKARHIGDKTLFLLPDLSLYLKDPLLKRSLWKALCQICESASP